MAKHITAKKFYSGFDPETGQDFTLQVGESIEVSDEKIKQLERDGLLERFEVGKAAAKTATSTAGEELGKLKVPDLQKKATELGIEIKGADGKDLKKADLIKAIEAKQKPADELDEFDRERLIHVAGETGIADPADLDDAELRQAIRSARGGNG